MTTPADHTDTRDGLTLLLGPRQADIMRLFWTHGQATMRQIQQWLTKDADLAYTTVATLCVRMAEKGLLLQQRLEVVDQRGRHVVSYVYTPLISKDEFVRTAVTQQLDRLLAHYPGLVFTYVTQHVQRGGAGEDVGDRATENKVGCQDEQDRIETQNSELRTQNSELVAALRERAAAAERQAATWEAQARRAQHQAKLATARLEQAEARAVQWEATARRATAQALVADEDADAIMRRVALQQHAATRSAPEWFDLAGVCRVCNQPVPDAPAPQRHWATIDLLGTPDLVTMQCLRQALVSLIATQHPGAAYRPWAS
jgi:predicted transcriptional regulator